MEKIGYVLGSLQTNKLQIWVLRQTTWHFPFCGYCHMDSEAVF